MKTVLLKTGAAMLLILSSCSGPRKINPDECMFFEDYNDEGYAIVESPEGYAVAINRDNEIVTPDYSSIYYVGQGYHTATKDSESFLLDRNFQAIDTAMIYYSEVNDDGVIWAGDRPDHVRATDVRTGRTLFEENNAEFMEMNTAGLVVLRRCGEHYIFPDYHTTRKPVYDYMLVKSDGTIKAPWGRYKYVDYYSNGRAKFTNSAILFKVKDGIFAADEFEEVDRYTRHRFGYLDEEGDIVIPERYEMCDGFDSDGHARADEVFGDSRPNIVIDLYGNVVRTYRPSHGGLY